MSTELHLQGEYVLTKADWTSMMNDPNHQLIKNGQVIHTYSPEIYKYKVIDHYYDSEEVDNLLGTKINVPFVFYNVSASSWITNDNQDYAEYAYKCVISCQYVTSTMLATVIFTNEQANSGNYADGCDTVTDSVTIYSNDNSSITIPAIIAGEPVSVELHVSDPGSIPVGGLKTINGQSLEGEGDIDLQPANLTFSNITIETSDWVSDSTYTDYPYKAVLNLTGFTASMDALVFLAPASAALGIVPSFGTPGNGTLTIYSTSNESAITIDKVVAML